LKQQFEMAVDQKTDADKKPAEKEEDIHRAKSGKIDGEGTYLFDTLKGRVTHGDVTIRANIKDSLIGKPLSEDEPKELLSIVEAKVTIDLVGGGKSGPDAAEPSSAAVKKTAAPAKKEKP
jgi:hypothetical protein